MHRCTFVGKTLKLFLAVVVDKLLCNCNVHVLESSRLKTAVACIAKNDNNAEGGWEVGGKGKGEKYLSCSHAVSLTLVASYVTRLEICCDWQL